MSRRRSSAPTSSARQRGFSMPITRHIWLRARARLTGRGDFSSLVASSLPESWPHVSWFAVGAFAKCRLQRHHENIITASSHATSRRGYVSRYRARALLFIIDTAKAHTERLAANCNTLFQRQEALDAPFIIDVS